MKSAISGAHGFIGSHLSKRLSDLGHQVLPITQELLYEPLSLKKFFEENKPDYVFHLASYGNHSNQDDVPMTIFANIIGTFNMLSASADVNYKKFINFSTSSVNLDTETYYSASKASGERLCNAFRQQKQKPITSVRPYSVFGEGEAEFRFIPTICRAIILDEELELDPDPVHDWIYIEDFLDILIENLNTTDDILEIGTGKETTNRDIVLKLLALSGGSIRTKTKVNMRSYDNKSWIAPQIRKTKHTLNEALNKTYLHYEKFYKN